jgi:hypothetical protein
MTDESVPQPPRTVPHDRVVAAMELVYGPRPDLRPDIGIPAAQDDEPEIRTAVPEIRTAMKEPELHVLPEER